MKQQNNTYLTNDQIEFELVTLIDETGTSHGIIKTSEAQAIADERNLDLVLVSPNQKMPICKLMDYDKFRFDQNKKAKEQKKNQKNITTKEIFSLAARCNISEATPYMCSSSDTLLHYLIII